MNELSAEAREVLDAWFPNPKVAQFSIDHFEDKMAFRGLLRDPVVLEVLEAANARLDDKATRMHELAALVAELSAHVEIIEQDIIKSECLKDTFDQMSISMEDLVDSSPVWNQLENDMVKHWPEYCMRFVNGEWWDIENTPEGWEQIRQILKDEAAEPINHPEPM